MISATRRWLRRNRSGLAIGAGVVGATYLAGQYVVGKISEARERMTSDRLARENLRRRFEQNQTDCTFTVLALLPNVTENILEALPVEQLTHELQQKKAERLARAGGEAMPSELSSAPSSVRDGGDSASLSSFHSSSYVHASQLAQSESSEGHPRKSKAQLWNEIKISSITRALTLLYTLSLLTLLTRIQLNLLGRLNYLSSVISLVRPSPLERVNSISLEDNDTPGSPGGPMLGNDFETNRRYLAFTWFLLNKGYANLLSEIQTAVSEVFATISPTEAISASRLSALTLHVRQKIEGSTPSECWAKNWLAYLLPPRAEEQDLLVESGVLTPPSTSSTSSPNRKPFSTASNTSPVKGSKSCLEPPHSPLRKLLDETSDLIESPAFTRINTLLLDSLFSHLIDRKVAEQAFPQSSPPLPLQQPHFQSQPPYHPPEEAAQRITEIPSTITVVPAHPANSEPTAKLATILAVLTRQAHAIGNGNNPPNEYIEVMEREVREVEAFAAVIYSSQLNFEPGEEGVEGREGLADSGLPRDGLEGVAEISSGGVDGGNRAGEGAGGAREGEEGGIGTSLESAWSRVLGLSSTARR